jgi:hypothetical protein
MLRLSTECYVIRAHLHCAVAFGRITCIEDDRLETDMRSRSSGMDAIDGYKVLRKPSIGIATILMRCHVIFSVALVSQWQLVASLLAGVRTVRGQRTFMYVVGVTLRVSQKHCSRVK